MNKPKPRGDPVLSILMSIAGGLAFGQLVALFANATYTTLMILFILYWQQFAIAFILI